MYFKYIALFSFIIFLIYYFFNKNKLQKKVLFISIILIVIYAITFLISYISNISLKYCFLNSNPKKVFLSDKLNYTYKSENIYYSYDQYSNEFTPTETKKIKNKDLTLNIFNTNYYPISNIKYNINDSVISYNLKSSGNEIATLATALSSLSNNENINPINIISSLKYSDINLTEPLNMDEMLSSLYNEYDFRYMEISSDQIEDAINRGGLILVKVHGSDSGTIFTCSESYILISNIDMDNNYYVVNVNDKDYDTICPTNSLGFGNVILSNNNDSLYNIDDITTNAERFYVLWR